MACDIEESVKRAVSSRGVYNIALCSWFLSFFNIHHALLERFHTTQRITDFLSINTHSPLITMLFSIIIWTMGLALPGVHSIPTPSESFSVSKTANLARALPSGDKYPPQPPGGGPGKRGLLYNSGTKVGWSDFFVGSPYVTYGTNGDVDRGNELNERFSYVPTITVNGKLQNSKWETMVPVLIEGGTKALLA